jgi:Flp pilus assembly protein TadD
VVAGVVTARSERRAERAFQAAVDRRPVTEVEELFESSRALNPGAARELTMGRANFEAGRFERAERLMADAAELEPESTRVWFFRTRLALARGRRAEAARHWRRARALDPLLPEALPPPL